MTHPSPRGRTAAPGAATIDPERYDAVVFDLDYVITDWPATRVFPGVLTFIEQLNAAGLSYAVVSSSWNCAEVLAAAWVRDLFEVRVDGLVARELDLQDRPDPAIFLTAAHRLRVTPLRTVVVDDTPAGVEAGRAGGFGLVIGVDRTGCPADLAQHRADLVVTDLTEVFILRDGTQVR